MGVYLEVLQHGQRILPIIHLRGLEFGLLQRVLGILMGSRENPHQAYVEGWKISRVEDDPAGYLPWYMSSNNVEDGQEAPSFGSYEGRVVLEHMLSIGIAELSNERIITIVAKAYDEKLRREIPFKETEVLDWFKARREDLFLVLRTLSEAPDGKLNFY